MRAILNTFKTPKRSKTKTLENIQLRESVLGYLFMLPTIIGFCTFVVYPLIMSIYYSLTDFTGVGRANFVGLDNFKYMFTTDPTFGNRLELRQSLLF